MEYEKQIDPELRRIADKVPYNTLVIKCANIFQAVSYRLTKLPAGMIRRSMKLRGHQGLKFQAEVFEPSAAKGKLPCLLYVHGGAFSYKASAYHKKLAALYAEKAPCSVYFPHYHLLPEHPYPAAYDDVLALYKYVMENAQKLGIDAERIGVGGDSAGASIAALICNRCEREGLKRPCLQMLVYPLTDVRMQTESMKKFTDTPLWNAKNNRRMWSYYLKNLPDEDHDKASPMHGGLPRIIPDTYLETAEYDCLHDEGILYAERLRRAGAKVEINETKGTIHGYDSAFETKIARSNIEKRVLFLQKGFQGAFAGRTNSASVSKGR